jgi:hypothetical protein
MATLQPFFLCDLEINGRHVNDTYNKSTQLELKIFEKGINQTSERKCFTYECIHWEWINAFTYWNCHQISIKIINNYTYKSTFLFQTLASSIWKKNKEVGISLFKMSILLQTNVAL